MTRARDLPMPVSARHPTADRAMRVLFMADHLGHPDGRIHGGTTYFVNAIPALKAAGFDIDAAFLGPPHPSAGRLADRGVEPTFLSLGKYDLGSYGACKRLILSRRYDLVHLHSFKSHLLGRMAVRGQPVATIVHVHDQNRMKQPLKFLQGLLGPSTSALLGVSESVTEFASRHYNVPADRCSTLHNGIDIAPFGAARRTAAGKLRRDLGVPAERSVIVIAGRLTPGKGHPQLFEAMRTVVAEHPAAELWVVGAGEARDDYAAMVGQAGLDRSVRFLGQRTDMPEVFASADLAVVPSMLEEGFGLVALEAASAGLPVVAFDTGGVSSVVRDGETGIMVPRGDVAGLARAISSLLRDEPRRRALGQGGAALADSFTIEAHVAKLAQIYGNLVRTRGGAAP